MFGKCSEAIVRPSQQFWKIFGNLWKVAGNLRKIVKNIIIRRMFINLLLLLLFIAHIGAQRAHGVAVSTKSSSEAARQESEPPSLV